MVLNIILNSHILHSTKKRRFFSFLNFYDTLSVSITTLDSTKFLSNVCSLAQPVSSLSTGITWRIKLIISIPSTWHCLNVTQVLNAWWRSTEIQSISMLTVIQKVIQKLEGIKHCQNAEAQRFRRTTHLVLFQLNHNTFLVQLLLWSASTIFYYRSTFKRFPPTL